MKIITEGEKSKFIEFKSAEISADDFNQAFKSKKVKKYDLDGNKFVVVKDDETGLSAVYCLEKGAKTAKMVTRYELNKEKGITIYYTAAGEKTQEFATFESDLAKKIANARITRDDTAKASEEAEAVKGLVDEWVKETKPVVETYDAAMAKVAENIIIFDLIYKWAKEVEPAVEAYKTAKEALATVSKSIEDGESKVDGCKTKVNAYLDVLLGRLKDAGFEITGDNIEQRHSSLQAILEPIEGKDIKQRFEKALRVTVKNEEQVLAQVDSFNKALTAYESARKEMDDNDKQLEADRKIKNDCERELTQKAEALKKANAESKNIEELKKHESIQAKIEELLRGNADEQSKAFKDLPEYENKKFEDAQEEGADAWRKLDARKPDSKKGLMADLKGFDSIKEAIRDLFAKNAKVNRADLLTAVQKSAQDVWDKAFDAKTKADDAYVEEKIDLDRILEGVVAQEKYDALYRSVKGFLPILREEIKLGKTQPDGIVEFGYAGKDGKEEKACIFLAPAPEVEWASKYERFNGKLKEYVFFGPKKELLKGLFEDKSAVLHNAQVINMVVSNDKKDEKFKAAIAYYLDTTIVNGQFQEGTRGVRYISRDSVDKIRAAHAAYVRMHSSFVDNRDLVVEGSMKYRAEMSKIPGADEYKNRKLAKAVTAVLLAGLAAGTAITGVFHYNTYVKKPAAIELEDAQRQTALAKLEDESDKARTYGINQGLSKDFGVAYDKDGKPVYSNLPGLADVQIYKQENTGDAGTLTPEENQNLDKKFGYTADTQKGFAYGLGQAIAQKLAEDGLLELKRIGTDGTETITYHFDKEALKDFDQDELKAGYADALADLEIGGNSVIAEGIDPTNSELINAAEDKVKDGIVSVVKEGNYAYAFSEDGQTAYRIAITDGKNARTTEEFVEAVKNGQYEAVFTSAAALFKSDKAFWQDKYISGIEYSTTKVGKVEYFVVDESGVTTKKTADVKWIGASAIPNDMTMTKVAIAVNEGNKTISIKGASDVDASEIVKSLKPAPAAQADEGMGLGD